MNVSSLSYYLNLQYRRIIRTLDDNGLYPWLIIPLLVAVFAFISFRLLAGSTFGVYIFAGLAISLSFSLVDKRRYDFLKIISSSKDYKIIRLADQLILFGPFILAYVVFGWIWYGILLFISAIIFSLIDFDIHLPYSMPTPYGNRPFEFARGFRGSVFLIIGCYLIVLIGISVGNFNLSMSSIVGIGLVSGNYFIQPEPRFYIWIHSMNPNQFLIKKAQTILYYGLVTIAPIMIALGLYDPSRIVVIVLVAICALAFMVMCALAKYLAYPSEVNIAAGLAIAGSILFPPLMLIIIPVFYIKGLRRLEQFLR